MLLIAGLAGGLCLWDRANAKRSDTLLVFSKHARRFREPDTFVVHHAHECMRKGRPAQDAKRH
jgi:hypothetical protein